MPIDVWKIISEKYRSNTIIIRVITVCLKNSPVARPSSSRAATGCQTDHRRLPGICLAGMVRFTTAEQRNRLERLLLRLRKGGFLPADSPSFEELEIGRAAWRER